MIIGTCITHGENRSEYKILAGKLEGYRKIRSYRDRGKTLK
jgi:hypothetical protein